MAPEIATDSIPADSKRRLRVLDPMCGSGTVLAIAAERGHKAYGRDLDPLAVLMATVATANVKVNDLASLGEALAHRASRSTAKRLPWTDQETIDFADYWFDEPQQLQLLRIGAQIAVVSDTRVRQALQVALSRTIITKSPRASLAADTSHSRPHRVIERNDYNVYEGFVKSVVDVAKLLGNRSIPSEAVVRQGDARKLTGIPNSEIDLVITSPPYLNAIDYMRGHRLSLIWLGYTVAELRKIRSESIGSERGLSKDLAGEVGHLLELSTDAGLDRSDLPMGVIARYCHDLTAFSSEVSKKLKIGGKAVLVIGNSTLKGKYIRNDLMVQHAFESSGLECVGRQERELPENKRYLPIAAKGKSPLSKRMRTEVILTLSKAQ
uniref:hypothetical protein n=1 Tax=Mycobacterium sp. TaxID=1785 RepID=UPI002B89094D|nr:hypothetical protein [Mycobacterium sp.]HKP44029.1 hypothetical protein [Mycobacterium sp.]